MKMKIKVARLYERVAPKICTHVSELLLGGVQLHIAPAHCCGLLSAESVTCIKSLVSTI